MSTFALGAVVCFVQERTKSIGLFHILSLAIGIAGLVVSLDVGRE